MSRYNEELKTKLAWQTAYEQRTCPSEDKLYTEPINDMLQKHLSGCPVCRENRAMSAEEKSAWDGLHDKLSTPEDSPEIPDKCPGQVWALKKHLGGWQESGLYFQPPSVLLLSQNRSATVWSVAQIFEHERLMGPGDVMLDNNLGIAESWNRYNVNGDNLMSCLGSVDQACLEQVFTASKASFADMPVGSILYFFRNLETEVASFIAEQNATAQNTEPVAEMEVLQPTESLLQTLAEWFRPILAPAPLALAAAVVAVISIALLNAGKGKKENIAQAPATEQQSLANQPYDQSNQVKPDIRGPEAQPKPVQAPTLLACADVVMLSKGLTAVESLEVTRGGHDAADTGKAAYKIGIVFMNLIAADKSSDISAKNEAKGQLEHLLPIITGDKTVTLPAHLDDKHAIEVFIREIERAASKSGQLPVLRFGSWLQSARLADDERLLQTANPSAVDYFKAELAKQNMTPSTQSILNSLRVSLGKKDKNPLEIRKYLDELYDAY